MSCQSESEGSSDGAGERDSGEGSGDEESFESVDETRNLISAIRQQMCVYGRRMEIGKSRLAVEKCLLTLQHDSQLLLDPQSLQ